jgi:hypothetical protein
MLGEGEKERGKETEGERKVRLMKGYARLC